MGEVFAYFQKNYPVTCSRTSVRVERSRDTYRLNTTYRHLDYARCEREKDTRKTVVRNNQRGRLPFALCFTPCFDGGPLGLWKGLAPSRLGAPPSPRGPPPRGPSPRGPPELTPS